MEPDRQMEIQLGHMCNNRCVFCVSGQRTAMREAFPIAADPVIEKIREGRAQGIRKLTLLGGEPTLQPEFLDIVREAVALGFDEIVIFTNGVKTAREEFVDEILATGGNFTWRFSFQGGNGAAHDRTTKKLGSFQRIVQSMRIMHAKQQRITVNMCVVRSNYASVADFPALILPMGARQLHLDMVRPMDAGVRSEDEMRAMLPRYSDMVPHFEAMIAGFPDGFDVNIGNLPYCIAPELAPWIHHDGESTFTISIDHDDTLSEPWDKYAVKRRDKVKPASCRECVFDSQCSGVFDTYRRFYGLEELVPVTPGRLMVIDPKQRLFTLQIEPFLRRLDDWVPPSPFTAPATHVNARDGEIVLQFASNTSVRASVALRRRGLGGVAGTDRFSLHLLEATDASAVTVTMLRALLERLCEGGGIEVIHPVADDAGFHSAHARALGAGIDPRIGACLGRLRARAPFGSLTWQAVTLGDDGREAAIAFNDRDGGADVTVNIAVNGANVSGGYKLARMDTKPTPGLVEGVRSVMAALRTPA